MRNELGYNEADVFDLSPSQEVNTLQGSISPFSEPLRERYGMDQYAGPEYQEFKPGFFESEAWTGERGIKRAIEDPFAAAGGLLKKGAEFVLGKAATSVERIKEEVQERPKWGIPKEEETKTIQEAQKEQF